MGNCILVLVGTSPRLLGRVSSSCFEAGPLSRSSQRKNGPNVETSNEFVG